VNERKERIILILRDNEQLTFSVMATILTTSSVLHNSNLETFSLVWLDSSVNNSEENVDTQRRLRTIINHLRTFENSHDCEEYIRSVSNHDRIVIIVSGISGRQLIPRIHKIRQVCSIYVYCMNRKTNEKWTKQYNKVNRKHRLISLVIQITFQSVVKIIHKSN
jgi:hypothetical protein